MELRHQAPEEQPYAPKQQAFIWSSHAGEHYVRYPDGNVSGLMSACIAHDYAKMFGGTVHRTEVAQRRLENKIFITIVIAIPIITTLVLTSHPILASAAAFIAFCRCANE